MVSIDKADPEIMRPGMAAKLSIILSKVDGVLQIPEEAVRFDKGKPYVQAISGVGAPKRRNLELGRRAGDMVEVISGLKEGDRVVVKSNAAKENAS